MSAATDSNTSTIYISLLDEGTTVFRPTQGVPVREGVYEVLPTSDYNPEDEHWEFTPGSVVHCLIEEHEGDMILVAKELAQKNE